MHDGLALRKAEWEGLDARNGCPEVTGRGEKTLGPPSLAIGMQEVVVWGFRREGRDVMVAMRLTQLWLCHSLWPQL